MSAATAKRMNPADLFRWGTGSIAYIKTVSLGEGPIYAIYSASGGPLACVDSRDKAVLCVHELDMLALSVH